MPKPNNRFNFEDRLYSYPLPDVTRKHLFALNFADQTMSVIDTTSDTVTNTLSLPSGGTFRSYCYRHIDDMVYVWGTACVCKINANPGSANFLQITDLLGTVNAKSSMSGIGSYSLMDCAYDPVFDIVTFTTDVSQNYYYWDFYTGISSASILTIQSDANLTSTQAGTVYYAGNGRIAFVNNAYTVYYHSKTRKKLAFHNVAGNANLSQSSYWVRKWNYLYRGGAAIFMYDKNYIPVGSMAATGTGVGSQAQFCGSLAYSPDYDLMIGFQRQTGAGAYVFDISNNTALGSFTRTNLDTNETFASGCIYSLASKKFYLRGGGTTGTVTRIHKFNPQTWITNGKTNLADMIDGFITVGSLVDAGTNQNVMDHKLCMNHLIPY